MVPFSHIMILSGILFALGVACVSVRRNVLMILIGVEVMLNGAGLAFVAGSMRWMAAPCMGPLMEISPLRFTTRHQGTSVSSDNAASAPPTPRAARGCPSSAATPP